VGELKDYVGEFKKDVNLEDFSRGTLVRLFQAAAKCYLGIDGIWYSLIKERFGERVARDLEFELWSIATPKEVGRTMAAMNIQGNDVATVFKVLQCAPGTAGIMDFECDLKNRNHGILTVKRCSSLEYFERHRDLEGIKFACDVMDRAMYPVTAQAVNPNITVTPLKLPPRSSKDDIACQWEFRIDTTE
jgi:hypothetical protein